MSIARAGIPKSESHRNTIKISLKNSELIKSRKGNKTSRFSGYYISPICEKFDSSLNASKNYGVCAKTIRRWSKSNLNGWSFIPKGLE